MSVVYECGFKMFYARASIPDTSFAAFVAKLQKSKTRKDKDYFIYRVTIPKDVAKKMDVQSSDYIYFRAKKAEWFHMLDWRKMETTWQMLPEEIRNRAIREGLPCPGGTGQTPAIGVQEGETLSATSPLRSMIPYVQAEQVEHVANHE